MDSMTVEDLRAFHQGNCQDDTGTFRRPVLLPCQDRLLLSGRDTLWTRLYLFVLLIILYLATRP